MGFYEVFAAFLITYLLTLFSQTARYYAKFSVFILGTALSASFLPLPALLKFPPRDTRIGFLPSSGVLLTMKLLGFTYELRGKENINNDRGGVVVVNHQSGVDLAVTAIINLNFGGVIVIVKKIILFIVPFGPACWLWGTVFIDRKNLNQTKMEFAKLSTAIKTNAKKILIFPEGSRSQGEKFLPFKKGPFHLAIQTQSMIQPVVVSRYHFISHERKYFGRGHTIVSILPEISCQGLTTEDLPDLVEKIQYLMQSHFDEISEETKALNS